MEDEIVGDGRESFREILIKRRLYEEHRRPSLLLRDEMVLKDGPQTFRVAKHYVIVDHATKVVHHHSVTIETYRRFPNKWTLQAPRKLTISDKGEDEIARLQTFLNSVKDSIPVENGDYLVVRVGDHIDPKSIEKLLDSFSATDRSSLSASALLNAATDSDALKSLSDFAAPRPLASKVIADTLTEAHIGNALKELRSMIDLDASEREFQRHLSLHPWLFGSEYSEMLPRRRWTRDEQQDFMLRRTADGIMELVEIKTPQNGKSLFRYDDSHDSFFASSELSRVHGQVLKYLEQLDDDRLSIKARDGEDAAKVRAKIVIGRTGDAAQQQALRRFNAYIQRVEVMTFDQLACIGERVLSCLRQRNHPLQMPEISSAEYASRFAGVAV